MESIPIESQIVDLGIISSLTGVPPPRVGKLFSGARPPRPPGLTNPGIGPRSGNMEVTERCAQFRRRWLIQGRSATSSHSRAPTAALPPAQKKGQSKRGKPTLQIGFQTMSNLQVLVVLGEQEQINSPLFCLLASYTIADIVPVCFRSEAVFRPAVPPASAIESDLLPSMTEEIKFEKSIIFQTGGVASRSYVI